MLGQDNAQTMQSMNHLGVSLLLQSRFAEAEQDYRRLLDVERRTLGPDHPETLKAMANLSTSLAVGRTALRKPSRCIAKHWPSSSVCWAPNIRTHSAPCLTWQGFWLSKAGWRTPRTCCVRR